MINFVRRICNRIDGRVAELGNDLTLTLDAQHVAAGLRSPPPAEARDLPFALLSYYSPKSPLMNVGDAIQTIAVRQALEQIGVADFSDECLVRDELSVYRGRPVRCVMQGWFAASRQFWPSSSVCPVFVGTHLTLPTQQFLSRLLVYAPDIRRSVEIGCRDQATLDYCRSEGLNAYLSRCLTLTLPARAHEPDVGRTFLVDVPEEYLRHVPEALKREGVAFTQRAYETNVASTAYSPQDQTSLGMTFLTRYREEASLVVTTAIHVAMPCIAMGIPVCFIEGPATRDATRYSVLKGLVPIHTAEDLRAGKVDFTPPPADIRKLKGLLLENLRLSIARASGESPDEATVMDVRRSIASFDCTGPLP